MSSDSVNLIVLEYDLNEKTYLSDVGKSFTSFSSQFKREFYGHDYLRAKNVDLCIEELTKQSPLRARLVPVVVGGALLLMVDYYCKTHEFLGYVKQDIDFLTGASSTASKELEKRDYENYGRIIRPVVREEGSQLNITGYDHSTVKVQIQVPWDKASIAKSKITEKIGEIDNDEQISETHQGVILYLDTAVNRVKNEKVGDKGIVEAISLEQVHLIFPDRAMKEKILEDPFGKAYVVDVQVLTLKGKVFAYKIVQLHSALDK